MADPARELAPEALVDTLFSFLRTGVVKAAVELDLFTHVARGASTLGEIARAAGAPERGVRILLDVLASQGFVTKEGDRYSLPPLVEMLLSRDSAHYAGDFSRITANPLIWQGVGNLAEIVRQGRPPDSTVDVEEHPFWREFAEASERASELPASGVAGLVAAEGLAPRSILDVACGSGVYGFSLLEKFPEARLTSLDWPGVLERAKAVAERRGLSERVEWLPGSAFEVEIPGGRYDLVVASHFYHHFSFERNVELSRRLRDALAPGGTLLVHDWVADDARVDRAPAILFSVVMLASTSEGDVFTEGEYRRMLEAAGFSSVVFREVPITRTHVIFARKD
ncbi:MAG: O-methyltransferase [Candidatus Binatia bacterium]|nr:MAG: O-methyltransferase [Candidatus Binatia bacterium]